MQQAGLLELLGPDIFALSQQANTSALKECHAAWRTVNDCWLIQLQRTDAVCRDAHVLF